MFYLQLNFTLLLLRVFLMKKKSRKGEKRLALVEWDRTRIKQFQTNLLYYLEYNKTEKRNEEFSIRL